jgi:hypothetical protein
MSGLDTAQIISELHNTMRDTCKVSLETSYGLVININPDATFAAILKSDISPNQNAGKHYKYRMFPDYGAGFLWYDSSWNGNPEGEFEVDEDDIPERYGSLWNNAYNTWVDKYTKAFEKHELHHGSHKQPFPEVGDRKSWVLEGLLLAIWLCLQPDVDSVEYAPDREKVMLQKQLLGPTLQLFFKDLEKYLT